uniref:Uncharacterized protein n=1 Tax=Schistosoma japonicum TaxID=6182 RepID=C1LII5_SCHJA|nr:hypothetical protein [Schistosoma japonicum]
MDRKLRIIIITVVLLLLCGFGFFVYLFVTHKNTTQNTTTNQIQSDSATTKIDDAHVDLLQQPLNQNQVHEPTEDQQHNQT